jgi:AraC-like DNA-binding protein
MDRLSQLFHLFSLHAGAFYAGQICSIQDFEQDPHQGHLHLVMRGPLTLVDTDGTSKVLDEPSIIFMPRPTKHRLLVDERHGAHVICANVNFGTEGHNPITASLPRLLCLPLSQLPGSEALLTLMLQEAFSAHEGRSASLDRLCELILIQLIRHGMSQGLISHGVLAGLGDEQLALVLKSIQAHPAQPWSLEDMARQAGMSRTAFAERFKSVVGDTPSAFLTGLRITLAQQHLRQGRPLKFVAQEVGYSGTNAFTKAFTRIAGMSPGRWLKVAAEGPHG